MLSCGALERSSNPYIESGLKPCVSKNQKGIFAMWFNWNENPEKRLRQWKKNIPEPKVELVCMCVREKKQQFFLRYKKNVNLLLKKDFKFAELLTETSFSFTLETVLKMAKEPN